MLINDGSKSVNQIWISIRRNGMLLHSKSLMVRSTSSHVQHIISGERPWVITLSRGIRDRSGSGEKEGVFLSI